MFGARKVVEFAILVQEQVANRAQSAKRDAAVVALRDARDRRPLLHLADPVGIVCDAEQCHKHGEAHECAKIFLEAEDGEEA